MTDHSEKKYKALLIEDNVIIAELLVQRYKKLNIEIILIDKIEKLLKNDLVKNEVQLVIADYSLGSYLGKDLVKLVKDIFINSNIVMYSGFGHNKNKVSECISAGAVEFIDKSDLERLDQVLNKIVE